MAYSETACLCQGPEVVRDWAGPLVAPGRCRNAGPMAVIEQKALHVNNRMERGLLFTVARDATEWESLGLGEEAPDIDWEKQLAVVAVLGTRPSGGYRIEVAHAETAPGQVLVTIQEY